MTVGEFLQSLPEDKREMIADFLYGRAPCRLGLNDIPIQDTEESEQICSLSSQDYPAAS